MDLSLLNIANGLQGGINDPTVFPRWLDDNLYGHATFKSLLTQRRPYVWINASDIYDRTPFVFGRVLFKALCSDLTDLSDFDGGGGFGRRARCLRARGYRRLSGPLPDPVAGLGRARAPQSPTRRRCCGSSPMRMYRYHSGEVRYVKLLDGGMVDNYGLAGFTIARLASDTPYGPLEPEEGVNCAGCCFWSPTPAARRRATGRRPWRGPPASI